MPTWEFSSVCRAYTKINVFLSNIASLTLYLSQKQSKSAQITTSLLPRYRKPTQDSLGSLAFHKAREKGLTDDEVTVFRGLGGDPEWTGQTTPLARYARQSLCLAWAGAFPCLESGDRDRVMNN